MREEIRAQGAELRGDMKALRTELREEMHALGGDLRTTMEALHERQGILARALFEEALSRIAAMNEGRPAPRDPNAMTQPLASSVWARSCATSRRSETDTKRVSA